MGQWGLKQKAGEMAFERRCSGMTCDWLTISGFIAKLGGFQPLKSTLVIMKRLMFGLMLFPLSVYCYAAEDRDTMVKDAIASLEEGIELLKDGKLEDGAEEIRWGLELVDKAMQSGIDELLPEEIDLGEEGVFVGGEIKKNKMMGTSITERVYKNAAGVEIKVTLTRAAADGGGGFMAGMNSLAQFGMMQGERVRIGGVTGSAMDQGSEKTVILTLDDGTLYNASSRKASLETVKEFSREYPIRELNDAVSAN